MEGSSPKNARELPKKGMQGEDRGNTLPLQNPSSRKRKEGKEGEAITPGGVA